MRYSQSLINKEFKPLTYNSYDCTPFLLIRHILFKDNEMTKKIYGHRWETIDPIGEGGQSYVFSVRDSQNEFSDTCVLKRLKNLKRIDRFKNEIQAVERLDHPRIAPIFDYSLEDPNPYFVTKYYPNGTLKKLVEVSPLDPIRALTIFIDICEAISYAHSKDIVHRDLKPENIILDENEQPVILDFGICYFIDDDNRLTKTTEQVGSRYYIAPELEGGRAKAEDITTAVDSYSLGKILYFLLSSQHFAREEYTGSQSLEQLRNNPQLKYITEKILQKSVVNDFKKRVTVLQLKEEAEIVRRLIYEHFYPGKEDSRCRFCGEGIYKKTKFAGLKIHVLEQRSDGMAAPFNEIPMNCECFICDKCNNIQWFIKPK